MCSFSDYFNCLAANRYTLPPQMCNTKESGKKQAPIYSMTGRSKIGGFHQDLQKVFKWL